MKFILDTDTIIYFLKGNRQIVEKITMHNMSDLTTSIINHSELLFSVFNSTKKKENQEKISGLLKLLTIVPYCEKASTVFAEQKTILKKQGNPIADLDLMIASITIANKSILVTNNLKHFSRIKNLKLENWYHE